jgi:hypothetical protein
LKKRAGEGILIDVIVLLSLVICFGSLYGFVKYNQNRDQRLESTPNNVNEPLIVEEPGIEEIFSLAEAIIDLRKEGCRIVNVKAEVYLDNPQYVSYKEFKSKALESQIVVVSLSDSSTILLVQIKSVQWVWIPS